MLEPLYTAAEMKEAEAGHDVQTLMERAGRAVADEALRRYPDAQSFGAVCGGGANGGDGRIALDVLRSRGQGRGGGRRTATCSSTPCSEPASTASRGQRLPG